MTTASRQVERAECAEEACSLRHLPRHMERALRWLRVAWRRNTYPPHVEPRHIWLARLRRALQRLRTALRWATRAWLEAHPTVSNARPAPALDTILCLMPDRIARPLRRAYEVATGFENELQEAERHPGRLWHHGGGIYIATCDALQAISDDITARLPLRAGQWLALPDGRWARLLRWDGRFATVDLGECGIERIMWCHYIPDLRHLPPLSAVVEQSDAPLRARWRRFATDTRSAGHVVCQCCAYPSLETDVDEIIFCLFCGWSGNFGHQLQNLDEPTDIGDRRYTVGAARLNFNAHGDCFAADDASADARMHRLPGVIEARRQAIAEMEIWLDAQANSTPLPRDGWQRLDDLLREAMWDD